MFHLIYRPLSKDFIVIKSPNYESWGWSIDAGKAIKSVNRIGKTPRTNFGSLVNRGLPISKVISKYNGAFILLDSSIDYENLKTSFPELEL